MMLRNFARKVPMPILGIAAFVILPLFAIYLCLCVAGAAVAAIFEKDEHAAKP